MNDSTDTISNEYGLLTQATKEWTFNSISSESQLAANKLSATSNKLEFLTPGLNDFKGNSSETGLVTNTSASKKNAAEKILRSTLCNFHGLWSKGKFKT